MNARAARGRATGPLLLLGLALPLGRAPGRRVAGMGATRTLARLPKLITGALVMVERPRRLCCLPLVERHRIGMLGGRPALTWARLPRRSTARHLRLALAPSVGPPHRSFHLEVIPTDHRQAQYPSAPPTVPPVPHNSRLHPSYKLQPLRSVSCGHLRPQREAITLLQSLNINLRSYPAAARQPAAAYYPRFHLRQRCKRLSDAIAPPWGPRSHRR